MARRALEGPLSRRVGLRRGEDARIGAEQRVTLDVEDERGAEVARARFERRAERGGGVERDVGVLRRARPQGERADRTASRAG